MLKALAHPVRLEIVQILSDSGEANCVEFTRHAGLAQSTVSEHLRILRSSGLVRANESGPCVGYCIVPANLRRLRQLLEAL